MEKLKVSRDKTLRLSNVLRRRITKEERENDLLVVIVEQMKNYIKSKGTQQVGPLIQYTQTSITTDGEMEIRIDFLLQSNTFINHVEAPYSMKSVLRIKDCMYVRFEGIETKLKFAYDKINLTAYEEDIGLMGDSYTVFVNQIDENIIADVFMEKKHE